MKNYMRIVALTLALICIFSIVPFVSVSAEEATFSQRTFTSDQNDVDIGGETFVIIRTVDQLLSYQGTSDHNMILANNLDFGGQKMGSGFIKLDGKTFDGNGYTMYNFSLESDGNTSIFGRISTGDMTIRNLTVGLPNQYVTALCTGTGKSNGIIMGNIGTISNLLLENVKVYANLTNTNANCGLLLGNMGSGKIVVKNCKAYGSVTNTESSNKSCGGLVGIFTPSKANNSLLIENCESFVTVSNVGGDTGGIIGKLNGKGVTGFDSYKIIKCCNYGSVTGDNVGGAIGCANTKSTEPVYVDYFLNLGALNGENGKRVAGIVAFCTEDTYLITNSANFGTITGTRTAAGLIGNTVANMEIKNCGSFAKVSVPDVTTVSSGNGHLNALLTEVVENTPKTVENLYYLPITGEYVGTSTNKTYISNSFARTSKTLEEGIAWANALFTGIFDTLILNSDGDGVVTATPRFVALQQSAIYSGTMNIRLASILADTLRYSEVGYKLEVSGNVTTIKGSTVYRKLMANEGGVTEEITAQALGGSYIFALIINNVPATETVSIKVTPYAKGLDETVYEGDSYVITFVNGVCTSCR